MGFHEAILILDNLFFVVIIFTDYMNLILVLNLVGNQINWSLYLSIDLSQFISFNIVTCGWEWISRNVEEFISAGVCWNNMKQPWFCLKLSASSYSWHVDGWSRYNGPYCWGGWSIPFGSSSCEESLANKSWTLSQLKFNRGENIARLVFVHWIEQRMVTIWCGR